MREAVAAFGRGECFVERFLDHPRHVETQCLADQHGNVVVVSTRDCSLQRRNQKLVEEAPAPFLTDAQHAELYRASKAILREAGYVGAGTCEFLVGQDGTISFLEVNTRLQVEHPVTEEVTGIDLVREQFRIAAGEPLGYDDPEIRGHSIEFRINGEDAGRGFLPAPGTVTRLAPPSGPGVRLDSGFVSGDVIGGTFDSMLAKLIVTGARPAAGDRSGPAGRWPSSTSRGCRPCCRSTAPSSPTRRSRRPDPAAPFTVHTRWIETEFDNTIEPCAGAGRRDAEVDEARETRRRRGRRQAARGVAARPGFGVPPPAVAAAKKAPQARPAAARPARAAGGDALDLADAGHDRQDRRRGGAARRGR